MDKDIETVVKDIIAKVLKVSASAVNKDTAIGDIPEWDSLHHIQIIAEIEKKFEFQFTPDIMMDLEDVSDIINATKMRANK